MPGPRPHSLVAPAPSGALLVRAEGDHRAPELSTHAPTEPASAACIAECRSRRSTLPAAGRHGRGSAPLASRLAAVALALGVLLPLCGRAAACSCSRAGASPPAVPCSIRGCKCLRLMLAVLHGASQRLCLAGMLRVRCGADLQIAKRRAAHPDGRNAHRRRRASCRASGGISDGEDGSAL
jgi:hypothetical protein